MSPETQAILDEFVDRVNQDQWVDKIVLSAMKAMTRRTHGRRIRAIFGSTSLFFESDGVLLPLEDF